MGKNVRLQIIAFQIISLAVCLGALTVEANAFPDLVVSNVEMTRDRSGLFVGSIRVTVANGCLKTTAGPSYVVVTFKDSEKQDAKPLYYIGNAVKPLNGGVRQTLTFKVSGKKIVFGRYVLVEVDPYKKVVEASESNNWRTLFPEAAGETLSKAQCKK